MTTMRKNEDWLASDFDDPLETAILYNQVKDSPQDCGHAVKWKLTMEHVIERRESTCPICTKPIAMIVDGSVPSACTTSAENQVATFKFGKQVFRLSCGNSASSNASIISWAISFLLGIKDTTAQQRMAYALGMNIDKGFKILYKGKVLYPSNSKSSSTDRDSLQLSKRILEISGSEWDSHKKAALVVMGTRVGSELKGPPKPGLFQTILLLPLRITQLTIGICWNFVASFVRPLIGNGDHHDHED
jgi:hypothetical protein